MDAMESELLARMVAEEEHEAMRRSADFAVAANYGCGDDRGGDFARGGGCLSCDVDNDGSGGGCCYY